jgi:fatty acid desaturase
MQRNQASEHRLPNSQQSYRSFVNCVMNGSHQLPTAGELLKHLKQSKPTAFQRDYDIKSYYYLFELLARLALVSALILYSVQSAIWWLCALAIMFQACNYLGAVSFAYDCAHRSAFKSNKMNTVVGLFLATLVFVRFFSFQRSHIQHHKFNQSLKDPKRNPIVQSGEKSQAAQTSHIARFLSVVLNSVYAPAPIIIKNILLGVCRV